jgi:hypothetical protein
LKVFGKWCRRADKSLPWRSEPVGIPDWPGIEEPEFRIKRETPFILTPGFSMFYAPSMVIGVFDALGGSLTTPPPDRVSACRL